MPHSTPHPVQVDAYARQQGIEVVGYYHANERLTDLELGSVARKIADRIQQRAPRACALLVRAHSFCHALAPRALLIRHSLEHS